MKPTEIIELVNKIAGEHTAKMEWTISRAVRNTTRTMWMFVVLTALVHGLLWTGGAKLIAANIGPLSGGSVGIVVDDLALSASPTFTNPNNQQTYISVGGYNQLTVFITYTRGASGAASDVRMVCASKTAGDSSDYPIEVLQGATFPELESDQRIWVHNVSVSEKWSWNIPTNYDGIDCTFTATGAHVSDDRISVRARIGGI